ncbi:30S ribosomal protein S7 [Weissella viridescens]|uniref:30S ribosomal protein S7 n=1 Tax=Weissella viridescens TaxID=1629 RepID=A0A380NW46_WEIVI|nr:30S ribosomal protein S7 [Weissella viridescens]
MPRKSYTKQAEVLPDPIYNSKLVSRLINRLMIDGKRGTASTICTMLLIVLSKKLVKNL